MAWKRGPMPKGTYGWGGVVPFDHSGSGFYFADFRGDTVALEPDKRELQPHEVKWYDNSLELPPED